MITHVRLNNWKSHKDTSFQLGEGTNVLVGPMGSGKSAALEGITYALFGTLPTVKNRTIKLENLIKNRPNEEDSTEVEVGFVAPDGNEYKVRRRIERGKGTVYAELRKSDGELIDKPQSTRVTEHVSRLLELDYDLFERMIYAEQNRLDYFLTLPPGKRKENLDELLGINKLENARKNTTTIINRLHDRRRDREEDVQELQEDEEIASLSQLEGELESLKKDMENLREERKKLEPKIRKVEKRMKKLEELENKIQASEKNITEVNASIRASDRQIRQVKEELGEDAEVSLKKLKEKHAKLKEQREKLDEKLEETKSQHESHSSKASELAGKRDTIEQQTQDLSQEIKRKSEVEEELQELQYSKIVKKLGELKNQREENHKKLTVLETRIKDANQTLEDLQKAETTCPVCERPLTEEHRQELLQKKRGEVDLLEKQKTELENKSSDFKKDIQGVQERKEKAEELQEEVKNLHDLEKELKEQEELLNSINSRVEEAEEARGKVKKDLEELEKKAEELREEFESVGRKIQQRKNLQDGLEEKKKLENKIQRLKKELQKLQDEYNEKEAAKLKQRHEDLILRNKEVQTEISGVKKLISEKGKRVESARKKQEMLDRYEAEVKSLRHGARSLNKVKTALAESQTTLRRQIIDAVNRVMNNLWEEIYPYRDFPSIRLAVVKRRGVSDYELQLRDRTGSWSSVEGVASGGERTSAALALRIAFAEVLIPHLSWLVLDEPTHNLDSEGIEKLSLVLKKRVPKIMKQLILITHEKRLESAVSGYLYRFQRDKSEGGPTKVQAISTS
ncbi:hypothetical protein AKJ35_00025 [candidate division MSBL1 archaeon SCGC-AAA833F18]|uniref:Zinc-hook domain-containing protein n=2 Tax=candidate division MSBL1 TaxID=215777 RepID=A0A133VS51_9EURY|nr:hypothetical protein AKJ46_00650 [candidate division MSBL1 archaeon SCGC-AAA833K04]KXB09643.1 hypothetical protein AKJ35_00025 [candidate division MSBL1 archaeon SCGC-AAA833F18]